MDSAGGVVDVGVENQVLKWKVAVDKEVIHVHVCIHAVVDVTKHKSKTYKTRICTCMLHFCTKLLYSYLLSKKRTFCEQVRLGVSVLLEKCNGCYS